MDTIRKTFLIKNWAAYTPCEGIHITCGMELNPVIDTVINSRRVVIATWINDATGDGFEIQVHALNSGELA